MRTDEDDALNNPTNLESRANPSMQSAQARCEHAGASSRCSRTTTCSASCCLPVSASVPRSRWSLAACRWAVPSHTFGAPWSILKHASEIAQRVVDRAALVLAPRGSWHQWRILPMFAAGSGATHIWLPGQGSADLCTSTSAPQPGERSHQIDTAPQRSGRPHRMRRMPSCSAPIIVFMPSSVPDGTALMMRLVSPSERDTYRAFGNIANSHHGTVPAAL